MQGKLIITKDGSHSIEMPDSGVTYHSLHGAIQESQHVFIEAGLHYQANRLKQPGTLYIFEMGFGTGLNALLTLMEAERMQQPVVYETVEAFPLEEILIQQLNYCEQLQRPDLQLVFEKLHHCEWGAEISLTPFFTFKKTKTLLKDFSSPGTFHLIYYDAFAPGAQPELWTEETFRQLFGMLVSGGVLTTYCSKGDVRRAMKAAGFIVEKIPGPPGKREMVRAGKEC